jgi:hypothetical protein
MPSNTVEKLLDAGTSRLYVIKDKILIRRNNATFCSTNVIVQIGGIEMHFVDAHKFPIGILSGTEEGRHNPHDPRDG